MIKPYLSIAGFDYSAYLISVHCEQTVDVVKSPAKIDIQLFNSRQIFRGAFKPTDEIIFSVENRLTNCYGYTALNFDVLVGEVQKASVDEMICKIEGVCTMGGMSGGLKRKYTYQAGEAIATIVNELLDDYGFKKGRHINIAMKQLPQDGIEFEAGLDYLKAFETLCTKTGSWYFIDETGNFWYQDPQATSGAMDLTGYILNGDDTTSLVGYRNVVKVVVGTSFDPTKTQAGPEILTQDPTTIATIIAKASDEEIAKYGYLQAPPVYLPTANKEIGQKVADNLLKVYSARADNPKPKVYGIVPALAGFVKYKPYNGMPMHVADCSEPIVAAPSSDIYGVVIKRVLDLDAANGLVVELEIANKLPSAGLGLIEIGDDATATEAADAISGASDEEIAASIAAKGG